MAGVHVVLPLYRTNTTAQVAVTRLAAIAAADGSIRATILDKTENAVAAGWIRDGGGSKGDRLTIAATERTTNFFVDAARLDLGADEYIVMVHDDDDWTGLESLPTELARRNPDILVPRLTKVRAATEEQESLDWLTAGQGPGDRLKAFLGGHRPQTFLFAAVSSQVWNGWATFVKSRPLPSLSLDFTQALYMLMTSRPQVSESYLYRFNMTNWTDQRTALASTQRWLAQDGWGTLTAEDVWLIRLLDDLSLLGYLSDRVSDHDLAVALDSVVVAQDGLSTGRLRLGWASDRIPPRVRWALASLQETPERVQRLGMRALGPRSTAGWGRSRAPVDARPHRVLASLESGVLPALASACEGHERDQVAFWAGWVSVLRSRLSEPAPHH